MCQIRLQLRKTHVPGSETSIEVPLDLCEAGTAVEHREYRIFLVFQLKVLERQRVFEPPPAPTPTIDGQGRKFGTSSQGNRSLRRRIGLGGTRSHGLPGLDSMIIAAR